MAVRGKRPPQDIRARGEGRDSDPGACSQKLHAIVVPISDAGTYETARLTLEQPVRTLVTSSRKSASPHDKPRRPQPSRGRSFPFHIIALFAVSGYCIVQTSSFCYPRRRTVRRFEAGCHSRLGAHRAISAPSLAAWGPKSPVAAEHPNTSTCRRITLYPLFPWRQGTPQTLIA